MANQDRVNFVWAESALTTIPPIPVSEVAYRDTTQTPEQMEVGQQYDTIYNSARHNQLLFLLTSVAKTLCENGIMPFLAGQEYSQYARCIFTDGKLYTASRAILANEQPYPTPGDDSGVWTTEETGENFVPDSRRVIAGTGLTGGGPLSSDVTLAAKLTNSVSLTDSTTAASATAVKSAYDRGTAGVTAAGEAKTTAENALTVANSKQPNLGFTPVQQGGGSGQNSSKIYIGHGTNGLKAQIGTTDLGYIVTTTAGTTIAPSATKVYVENFGEMSWINTQYANSPANVWCLPAHSDYAHLCSPSVLSVGSSQLTLTSPNTRIFQTNGTLPKGGSWVLIVSRNGNGVVAQLAGGSAVDTSGGVALAIRVA